MSARRVWPNEPVVVHEGETETMAGCDLLRARIGTRINEIHGRIAHVLAKGSTAERDAFVAGLREEMDALVHTRGAVGKRKEILSHQQTEPEHTTFYAAVLERFGSDVFGELKDRARELRAARKTKHASALVGSAIPVGAIGGPRLRRDERDGGVA